MIGTLARRSVGKHSNTVRLLRYNSDNCNVPKSIAFFGTYRSPSYDQVITETGNLERHLATCMDLVKPIFPKNMYELHETLFEKPVIQITENSSTTWLL